jgi:gamma-glutamyltranspeptidase/glutathione hydrolase
VSRHLAESLVEERRKLEAHPASRAIFFLDQKPLREGDRLVQRDLARTLRRIAENGARGFYHGDVAKAMIAAVGKAGGVLEEADLAAYRTVTREPLAGSYRGHRVLTFPPPSSGGVVLLQVLGMLERYDLQASGAGSSLTIHRVAEAERRAFADRNRWLGDPAVVRVPLPGLLDPAYVAARGATIRDDAVTPAAEAGPGAPAGTEGSHTLHFSVADSGGAVVALTTTLNSDYGSGIVADGTGIVLNNEMDDFALAPGIPNQFGLVGGIENAVAPGKRPLSSMSPTIVEARGGKGRPVLVLGSRGGPRIISSVLEVLLNVLDHGMTIPEAIDAPRFHHQGLPDLLYHEKGAFPEDVAAGLRARGHVLRERAAVGNVAAIGLLPDGAWAAAPDPREEGTALGY